MFHLTLNTSQYDYDVNTPHGKPGNSSVQNFSLFKEYIFCFPVIPAIPVRCIIYGKDRIGKSKNARPRSIKYVHAPRRVYHEQRAKGNQLKLKHVMTLELIEVGSSIDQQNIFPIRKLG